MQVLALVRPKTDASFSDGQFTLDTQIAPLREGLVQRSLESPPIAV